MRLKGGRLCGQPSAWRCHRRGHDALCQRCVRARQTLLVGPPSKWSSTDVYDAVVGMEPALRREGTVFYLSGVASRRPPQESPNWRTSYRLKVRLPLALLPFERGAGLPWRQSPACIVGCVFKGGALTCVPHFFCRCLLLWLLYNWGRPNKRCAQRMWCNGRKLSRAVPGMGGTETLNHAPGAAWPCASSAEATVRRCHERPVPPSLLVAALP